MLQRWITRLGPAYIVWMMIVTRLGGLIGGALVVYYVGLTTELSGALRFHWNVAAATVVLVAVTVTVVLAMWETRQLRAVMHYLHLGRPFSTERGRQAGSEAVVFPIRHHLREAILVPLCTLPPVYVYLTWVAHAPMIVLVHITIATFIGVVAAVSITYFVIERMMHPVVRHLLDYGVVVDYENLPSGRIYNQILFSFTLTVIITALMIATLATQKASRLVDHPGELDRVVRGLRIETIAISACAVLMALVLSTFLAKSISIPVQDMVRAMRRVEAGSLTERITAVSTNEIGMLGRSFNRMVDWLEQNQRTIEDLNAGLEQKVKERTRELKLAHDRLVQSEKMTSLGELVAGIAHEINNSINAVYNGILPMRSKIEQLQRDLCPILESTADGREAAADADQVHKTFSFVNDLAEVVESGAKRAAVIVTDLKKFGHPGDGRRSIFDVHEGMKIAMNLLSNKMKNRVEMERDFCDDGTVVCSGTQLTQVFLNLLDNAQQAIAGNGTIHVSTRRDADQLAITFRDSGTGIPKDIQGRVFDPFFTTKEVGVGTGLGLSISFGIVKSHGGSIEVSSPPPGHDKGTLMTITLPVTPEQSPGAEQDADRLGTETANGQMSGGQDTALASPEPAGTALNDRTIT